MIQRNPTITNENPKQGLWNRSFDLEKIKQQQYINYHFE